MQGFGIDSEQHHIAAIALLLSTLSEREREVMAYVCTGDDTATIAERLHVMANTVERQRGQILRKMGARNSTQMAYLLKGAEAYHLRRYIRRLQEEKKHPQAQFGVLQLIPEYSADYRHASATAMEPILFHVKDKKIGGGR